MDDLEKAHKAIDMISSTNEPKIIEWMHKFINHQQEKLEREAEINDSAAFNYAEAVSHNVKLQAKIKALEKVVEAAKILVCSKIMDGGYQERYADKVREALAKLEKADEPTTAR